MIPKYSAIAPALANHLWQSTLFALLAVLLAFALRNNRAQVRYRLLLAASLKFLFPFSLLIALGGQLAGLHLSLGVQSRFYAAAKEIGQPFTFVVVSASREATATYLLPLLGSVWLFGFIIVLGLWLSRWRRVAAAIDRALPVSHGREVEALRHLERMTGSQRPIRILLSGNSLEPGIFGIVRPALLWPAPISAHLQDAHLKAILAHELSHVRRRDNLAAAVHMAVEAIFWFHPLVWWLGARLIEERERACDEEVLRLGNPPQIYAESILETCKLCVGAPLACITGVTGGDLKKRIVRIMTCGSAEKLGSGRRLLLAAVGLAAVMGPIIFGLLNEPSVIAQSPQAKADSQPATAVVAEQSNSYATSPHLYHVGGDVSAPKLVFAPDPEYTEKARQAKYQGVCVLSLVVDPQGNPQRVQVVRHLGMGLDKKAVEAAKQYRFKPAMLHGKPVPVTVNIEVNFRIY